MFDVSGLIPEARQVALEVAEVYWRHTHPCFIGLVCFGSAVRGGLIPGASDIDFHLYLEPHIFTPDGVLPLELACAIHKDLSQIDPAPFRYIDGCAETGILLEHDTGHCPGAYHVMAGRMPIAEATSEELKAEAIWSLTKLNPEPPFVLENLLHHGTGRGQLAVTVRQFCQVVWPVVYQLICLQQEDAIAVWQLPKDKVIELIPSSSSLGSAVRAFDRSVRQYYPAEESVNLALEIIRSGTKFLKMVSPWSTAIDAQNHQERREPAR